MVSVHDVLYRVPRRALAPLRRVPDDTAKEVRVVASRADLHVRTPPHGATESSKGARQKCHRVPLRVLLRQLHDAPEDSPVSLLLHSRPHPLAFCAPAGDDAKTSGHPGALPYLVLLGSGRFVGHFRRVSKRQGFQSLVVFTLYGWMVRGVPLVWRFRPFKSA